MRYAIGTLLAFGLLAGPALAAQGKLLKLSLPDYEDRVRGAWIGQIIGTLVGKPFEGKVASSPVVLLNEYGMQYEVAPVDDDYYYELIALRAFEKYGIGMTLDQLGQQWKENFVGAAGSSTHTRLALAKGVKGNEAGHPRHNRLWWTIGPHFSADIYGMLAPGNPNLAGRLARTYGHINGYAEGADGAVFVAGMVSLAFREADSHKIVREAAIMIHPSSPYRQCLNMVISMAEEGKSPQEVFQAVEDRWHIEYPPINNGVANGGLVAASVWFGEGDYLKTLNLAYRAADYSDADCNAANAGAVVGAMRGSKVLPPQLVESLHDRMAGETMGSAKLRVVPPVDERLSEIIKRIVAVGRKMLAANGARVTDAGLTVPYNAVVPQPAELFALSDLTGYWNPDWRLERAGFGGVPGQGPGGVRCSRITFLDGDVLATWPAQEVRGVVFRRTLKLGANPSLGMEMGADKGCAWQLNVFVNNTMLLGRVIEGAGEGDEKNWQKLALDLSAFRGQEVEIRIYQRTLLPDHIAGNAYWRDIRVQ
ncbi:MAG: ADP-ribosylglycohydrolase family protein [Acidobacteriota bacterium]